MQDRGIAALLLSLLLLLFLERDRESSLHNNYINVAQSAVKTQFVATLYDKTVAEMNRLVLVYRQF